MLLESKVGIKYWDARQGENQDVWKTYHVKSMHLIHSHSVCVVIFLDVAVRELKRE